MTEAEKRFREAERRLDEMLRSDDAVIAASGITIADRSARVYHYKNESLSWSYRFETRRARGSEIENTSVTVSLYEHEPDLLRVGGLAEIFQIGQLSRWRSTTEALLPLGEVERVGLASIVLDAIRTGEELVAGA
jgi:hypothetical protein